ncbi:hypothetical protein L1987_34086 [Smallanthus sonchifolius]|uniref:Uncharacterized protein n=1 Tax=Smallanthus sonchifolius TaxID=185202 RepID=A0ACB9HVF3_9ASTR|nr:hypothetical protein L1987_34086 [Smallanthus sonchifolius]
MDDIKKALRGPPDSKQDNKTVSGWAVQAIQLRKVISIHVQGMIVGTNNIFLQASQNTGQGSISQDNNQLCVRLQELISEALVNMHAETQKILKWTPIKQDNTPVSRKEHEAMELQMLIFKHIANMEKNIGTIYQAHELKRVFFEHIDEMEKETQKIITKYAHETYQALLRHALRGNRIIFTRSEAAEMNQAGVQLATIDEKKPLTQQPINTPVASRPPPPKLPRSDLINGPRENYLKIGVPLYEASIKCDWKAAKAIFDEYTEMKLETCSITENGETALHVAASAKGPKHVEEFVKNLVDKMHKDDLELQNNNHNTALYLAAAAGNIKAIKIMVGKNKALLTIAGSNGSMMHCTRRSCLGMRTR